MESPPLLNDLRLREVELRNRLLQIMMDKPNSVAYFADFVGVTVVTMRNFFNGKGKPTLKTLALVAKYVVEQEKRSEEIKKAIKKVVS